MAAEGIMYRTRTAVLSVALVIAGSASLAAQNPARSGAKGKSDNYIYFAPSGAMCNGTAAPEVKKVKIKSEFYTSGMISPDSAKAIALCWVPGQISSGEMDSDGSRTVYTVTILPTDKKTYSKVIIDAKTGQVLSTKQFGGARGLTGFLRESAKRKANKTG
jgi:uncharacterized membrane protein YkoI